MEEIPTPAALVPEGARPESLAGAGTHPGPVAGSRAVLAGTVMPAPCPAEPGARDAPQGPLRVEEVRDLTGFDALESEWNALARRTDDQVFHRHEFLRCWLEHFGQEGQLRVLVGRGDTGRLEAGLVLREVRGRQYGLPVRQLLSPTNKHSCRFDLLAEDPRRASVAFLSHLLGDPGWDLLRLADVPEGGAAWSLLETARGAGLPCGVWPSAHSPYMALPPTVEAWQEGRGRHAKPLRRRRRRLEERGQVTVERTTGPEGLAERLVEGFALEHSGWKARQGTAILQESDTLGFYTSLASVAARQGWLGLYFLRLDSRPVAFQYGLDYGGRYLAMKPAYDESFSEVSPGQLLMESLVQDCIARGNTEVDLLGDDAPYKREWTETVRPHHWLFIYRDTWVGRTLYRAKFNWAPVAKRVMSRWVRPR